MAEEEEMSSDSGSTSPYDDDDMPQPDTYVDGPRPQDVASTRDKVWHSNPQNEFYYRLIEKAACSEETKEWCAGNKHAAERIVDIIMKDKRGVFVKAAGSKWLVMDRNAAVVKAQAGIRAYQVKHGIGEFAGKKKKKTSSKTTTFKKKPPVRVRQAGPVQKPVYYRAQTGTDVSIHPYALMLVDAVCKHAPRPKQALSVLKAPLKEVTPNGEDPKERAIRLQLRHRFAGALSSGVSPVFFAEKLLEVWGGSLARSEEPFPSSNMNVGETQQLAQQADSQPAESVDETDEEPGSQNMDHEPSDAELLMGVARGKSPNAGEDEDKDDSSENSE